jgi:hypothetical protein
VPFLLAAPRPPGAPGVRPQARLERLTALWDELRPLEEAAWRGELSGPGLARLQRLRVEYAGLFGGRR